MIAAAADRTRPATPPERSHARPGRLCLELGKKMARISEKTWDCVGIVLVGALVSLVLRPFQNAPFVDDFTYAWPVEELFRHGRLGHPEAAQGVVVSQTLWGALYCLPFGFSFTALRVSTWLLALSALCGTYLTARELGAARRDALLGAAALGVYPVFFMLGVTFMTDVPLVACLVWCGYAFVRAVRGENTGWLLAAALLASVAVGVRPVAVLLPGAMLMVLLLHAGSWGRRGRFLIAAVPLLVLALLYLWKAGHTLISAPANEIDNGPQNRIKDLRYAFEPSTLCEQLVAALGFVAGAVGVAILPLTLACLRWKVLARSALLFVLLGLFLWGGYRLREVRYCLPLNGGETWALEELGATSSLVPGYEDPEWPQGTLPQPETICWALLVVGWGSFSIFLATQWRRPRPGKAFFLWIMLGYLAMIAVLWLDYDRYALPFVPAAILALLAGAERSAPGHSGEAQPLAGSLSQGEDVNGASPEAPAPAADRLPRTRAGEGLAPGNVPAAGPMLRPGVAAVFLAGFGALALIGVRDHLAYNAALWQAVAEVRQMGAKDAEINGGWMVNGWLQYAHPENAHREKDGHILIPWLNDQDLVLPYKISNRADPGWKVLTSVPYRRWLAPSGAIFVLVRADEDEDEDP
jgi:hypothetical protein